MSHSTTTTTTQRVQDCSFEEKWVQQGQTVISPPSQDKTATGSKPTKMAMSLFDANASVKESTNNAAVLYFPWICCVLSQNQHAGELRLRWKDKGQKLWLNVTPVEQPIHPVLGWSKSCFVVFSLGEMVKTRGWLRMKRPSFIGEELVDVDIDSQGYREAGKRPIHLFPHLRSGQ